MASRQSSNISNERKELLRMEQELKRKEEELRRRINGLPQKQREIRERERKIKRIDATTVARGEYVARVQHQRGDSSTRANPRALRIQQRQGKIKFFVLCMIFMLVLVLLWRAIPG